MHHGAPRVLSTEYLFQPRRLPIPDADARSALWRRGGQRTLHVEVGVRERAVEVVEQVALMRETVEHAHRAQRAEMLGPRSLDQHRDVTSLELGDDLTERLCPGGVE